MELFTKENKLPPELQSFAYDVDSVMHFGERDYSKNGHRTIIFKDFLRNPVKQNRVGLTPLDLRKIDVVYGPECRKRDRQEKLEICQNYPGVARKKREVDSEVINLRVNRDITPPPNVVASRANNSLRELGIENEVQDVVDEIYKVSSKALRNARAKYCNETKPDLRESEDRVPRDNPNPDILGIIETIADYAKHMVNNAVANLTEFCKESENMELYQRARCPYYQDGRPCPQTYRSTKSGRVKYSTQHRPVYIQSTKHRGNPHKDKNFVPLRTGNETSKADDIIESRRKRHLDATTEPVTAKENINSRRDGTGVGIQRSRDEEATTVDILRRNDDQETAGQRRIKRSVEVTAPVKDNPDFDGRKNDATSRKDNESSDKGDLRTATDLPVNKHHPERSLRRIFQKKKALRSESWADSKVSYEKEDLPRRSQEAETEGNVKSRNEGSHFERSRQKTDKRMLSRKPRLKHSGNRQKQDEDGVRRPNIEEGHSPKPKTVRLSKENVEFYSERKWPDGVVRYILEAEPEYDLEDVRRRLEEVNSILKRRTCARLEEITQDETEQFEDYLVVDTGPDFVTGRVGGRQLPQDGLICVDCNKLLTSVSTTESPLSNTIVCHGCGQSLKHVRHHTIRAHDLLDAPRSWDPSPEDSPINLCYHCWSHYLWTSRQNATKNKATQENPYKKTYAIISKKQARQYKKKENPTIHKKTKRKPKEASKNNSTETLPLRALVINEPELSEIILPNYKRASSTSKHCIFTRCLQSAHRHIPTSLRRHLLNTWHFYIPGSCRSCDYHSKTAEWDSLPKNSVMFSSFSAQHIEDMIGLLKPNE